MNKLLPAVVCVALVSSFPAHSAEEKSASSHSEQTITIPDSLDGYTLTMTSKEIKYVHIGYYILGKDDRAIVRNGEIGNYYEKNKEDVSFTSDSPYHATILFSKNQWTEGKSSGNYTCEKIGNNKLLITRIEVENGELSLVTYQLFLYFTTPDTGNAYSVCEELLGGNISFKLKKSSKKQ